MYTVEVTESQLSVIIKALGEYYNLRRGFYFDLADDVSTMFRSQEELESNSEKFLNRRKYAKDAYDLAYKIATDDGLSKGFHISGFTEESAIAYDMWNAFRTAIDNSDNITVHITRESLEPKATVTAHD